MASFMLVYMPANIWHKNDNKIQFLMSLKQLILHQNHYIYLLQITHIEQWEFLPCFCIMSNCTCKYMHPKSVISFKEREMLLWSSCTSWHIFWMNRDGFHYKWKTNYIKDVFFKPEHFLLINLFFYRSIGLLSK